MNFEEYRVFQNKDWVTLVFVFIFIAITVVKLLYPKQFIAFLGCLFSKKYFLDYANELSEKFSFFNGVFFVVQNLIGAMILLFFWNKINGIVGNYDVYLFLNFFLGLNLYLIISHGLLKLLAYLFQIESVYGSISIRKQNYLKLISLYALPLVLVVIYSPHFSPIFEVVLIVVSLFLLMFRWFQILINHNKAIVGNLFYFILYLCTLEIAPLLICGKIMGE